MVSALASEDLPMMNVCQCPGPDQIRAFVRGDLDSEDIDHHLEECPECRRMAETLDGGSTSLIRALRPLPSTATQDPALGALAAGAKALAWRAAPVETPDNRFRAGQQFGEYELLEPIALGGMGWVFKARHRRMNRIVAIKTIAPALSRQPEAAARFQREVEVLARLSHPHIVAAHDAFDHDSGRFLVMEYVEGHSVAQRVRDNGPLSIEQAVALLLQAARGLAQAHAAGIVHRDVKPGNLLLDANGTLKILDLGLARLTMPESTPVDPLTGGSVVMGTAAYMAPEQALDPRSADARADIYSLGCTLHFLLTGAPPHEGESVLATLLAHREADIPSLSRKRSDCPPPLDALFRRMLAKRPEERPASMAEVVRDLERIQKGTHRSFASRRSLVALALAACVLVGLAFLMNQTPGAAGSKPAPMTEKDDSKRPHIEMVRIEAGRFQMGSQESDRDAPDDEKPRHDIRITQPFLLGKFEITQEQYEEVMGKNPSQFHSNGRARGLVKGQDTRKHPVESISWMDAIAFCNRLSELHGFDPYYRIEKNTVTVRGGNGYRLPLEAEWEYAARAGTTTRWASGDDARSLDAFAWHAGNSGDHTHPVGEKKPNAWGLYDMHGNVPEWCWDRYDEAYYRQSTVSDPPGSGKGNGRVYRGGGWNHLAEQTRSAARNVLGTGYSVQTPVGMRVARNP
jgi:serine/threonine protein kinase